MWQTMLDRAIVARPAIDGTPHLPTWNSTVAAQVNFNVPGSTLIASSGFSSKPVPACWPIIWAMIAKRFDWP